LSVGTAAPEHRPPSKLQIARTKAHSGTQFIRDLAIDSNDGRND
jgi:hypothetical protein